MSINTLSAATLFAFTAAIGVMANHAIAEPLSYTKCAPNQSIFPCFAFWVDNKGSAFQGLVENGLLNKHGLAVYPDGAFYIGGFKDGRRHGLGVWSMNDILGWEGYWSIGYQSNDIRYGTNLYAWKNGRFWFGLDDGSTVRRATVSASDFKAWKDAFNEYGLPQRKYIQTVLANSQLKTGLSLYSGKIDGAWGAKTFTALAIYAALLGENYFNLQSYQSGKNTISAILRNDFVNFPYGYLVSEDLRKAGPDPLLPGCPSNPTDVKYKCFGSYKFAEDEIYNGEWENGQPNGFGEQSFAGGFRISGEFSDGLPVGHVTITDSQNNILFEGEPQTLRYAIMLNCSMGADGGQLQTN